MKKLIESSRLSDSITSRFQSVKDEELHQQLEGNRIQRDQCSSFNDTSLRFRVPQRVYTQQYSFIYNSRLNELKPRLKQRAIQTWPNVVLANGIKDLQSQKDSIVCGIIYKDMKLKPSVLDQYMKDLNVEAPKESFLSEADRLYLEDETVRIPLKQSTESTARPMLPNSLVTGLVMACRGKRVSSGEFEVIDWIFPGVITPDQPIVKLEKNEPRYVAFIAGLKLGCPGIHLNSILKGLSSYLLGNISESELSARHIIRLIVIGDTLFSSDDNQTATSSNTTSLKSLSNPTPPLRALDEADAFFASISPSLPIDVMPGPNDPTNASLPQQPLHQALLPQCRKISTFRSVTNPYSFDIEGIRFLGLASQSVDDILRFSDLQRPIQAMQLMADAQCLCPSAPDTLPCYPFTDSDPFCLPGDSTEAPHVLFSAGHSSFECRRWKNHQWEQPSVSSSHHHQDLVSPILITIPKFTGFKQLVLVDLTTLQCHLKGF